MAVKHNKVNFQIISNQQSGTEDNKVHSKGRTKQKKKSGSLKIAESHKRAASKNVAFDNKLRGAGGGSSHSPWQSGRHVEQETPPLLSLVELPDSRRSVAASTHKPESDNNTTVKRAAARSDCAEMKRSLHYFTFRPSGRTGCCPLCPV